MRCVIASVLASIVVLTLCAAPLPAAEDLRDQYGTSSSTAAKAIDDGIRAVKAHKSADALTALETAIKEDPHCQMSYYWKALAQVDAGDVDQALATYRQLIAVAEKTKVNNVTVDACINAGLTMAKLKQEKESRLWFSRAITLDPNDKFHLHWKAYRNMAISCQVRDEHASAAMCAYAGYLADPQHVSAQMVLEYLNKADKDEVARVLAFDDPPPTVAARSAENKLGDPAEVQGLSGTPTQLIADPAANRMLALCGRESKYYLIDCNKRNEVKAVDAPGEIVAASLAGGELYLSLRPSSIVKVDLASGKELARWPVSVVPTSLAALPSQGVVLFPAAGLLRVLDLDTGKFAETKFSAQFVAADPRQRFCYAYVREESVPTSGHITINGRPIFFRSNHVDWAQTALYKYAVFQKQPMLAELRLNAASNGRVLHVSPDGQWVAIAGGGGWRPLDHTGHGAGYGVAVFAAPDLGQVQGFFETGNYPSAVAVNPVTRQVVGVRGQDAKIYALDKEKDPLVVTGPFGTLAAWSPDGKYLYLSGSKSGLRAWPNTLSPQEEQVGVSWWKAVEPPKRELHAQQEAQAEPIAAYKTFEVKSDHKETLSAIAQAAVEGRTRKPIEWLTYAPYLTDKALNDEFRAPVNANNRENAGIRIYQLKKLRDAHATHPGVALLLGMTYYFAEDFDKSEPELLAAIHLDQGRTNLTVQALRGLRQIRDRKGDHEAAAFCAAHVLQLDLATPKYLDEAKLCFDQAKVGAEGDKLIQRGRQLALPAEAGRGEAGGKLPRLPIIKEGPVSTPEKIFAKAAPSVVMIRAGTGTGSGVCVADKGIILTNQHVVAGNEPSLHVYPYRYLNGKLNRLPPLTASVLYESAEEDLAVLQVQNPPATLQPLAVASAPPHEGAKVCAIGNPGLGANVLEQTISEGIVSSASRRLNGKTFIQHSAAVNPGNSGGPLLNERCEIIGIITTKANLENVSFAIPAEKVREIFDSQGKGEEEKPK